MASLYYSDSSCLAADVRLLLVCRFFETFSYLPPLSDDAVAKQVDYVIRQGWIPCLEFSNAESAYVKNVNNVRFVGSASCGYYDNRCASSLCFPLSRTTFKPPTCFWLRLAYPVCALASTTKYSRSPRTLSKIVCLHSSMLGIAVVGLSLRARACALLLMRVVVVVA